MNIQQQLLSTLPVLKVTDSLDKAIAFFADTTYSHIAVTDKKKFLGLLSVNDIACFEANKKVETYRYELETFSVDPKTSWLDVLEIFARNEANIIPVVKETGTVVGYYDLTDIVSVFIATPFFTEPGGILVVSKGIKDYSFSEIAQIVESNNTKLLGAFITNSQNDLIEITIKINSANLNEVIQSFRRYNYTIILGSNDDQFMEDLKERSDYLDKYLNV
ncbi:MAG: CBS domain-containing protein [Croceitalea sp.]|nr:CBS domain-containing protein [Croceitalea sp.]MBT8238574.1 CBS domain-containing protein [Croceitalea sp.]NNC34829.1 CBS domain-containing protein [Croceitalea sp.]NNL09420.1 CBS domain-containing protein [Croceitalea sp.]NNM17869.1 CBS domain-containing protein [Croceitalea sp.]